MQRQLQSYQQAVDDRNNQILNLNMVNNELQEKIEEMIEKTRSEILHISEKYSLPQLQTMNNELESAQETINSLKEQLLEKSQSNNHDIIQKLEKISQENNELLKDKLNYEDNLKKLEKALMEKDKMLNEFRKSEIQLTDENEKVKTQIQKICLKLGLSEADLLESDVDVHEVTSLKTKYGPIHDQLQQILTHLEATSPRRTNFEIIYKLSKDIQNFLNSLLTDKHDNKKIAEKLEFWNNMLCDFIESLSHGDSCFKTCLKESELRETIEELTNAKTMLEGEKFAMEYELKHIKDELAELQKEIACLNENRNTLIKESVDKEHIIQKLKEEISNCKKCLQMMEENKTEIEKQLDNTQKQLNEAKEETIELHKEVNGVSEDMARKNLFKELKNVENGLEQDKRNSESKLFNFSKMRVYN